MDRCLLRSFRSSPMSVRLFDRQRKWQEYHATDLVKSVQEFEILTFAVEKYSRWKP